MGRQNVVRGTRTMGNTQFTQKGSLPKYVRQILFDDLIEFERDVVAGRYNIEGYYNPVGLFISHKGATTWKELFTDVYKLDKPFHKTAKVFLPSLEQSKNLDEAIEFVASGYTDIELFRRASMDDLVENLSSHVRKGLFSLV